MVWWEGVLNNNNLVAYINAQTARASSGTISFSLTAVNGDPGFYNFDFNNTGSGGTGWYEMQSYGTGSISVTTY
jgi:hypothetical protein